MLQKYTCHFDRFDRFDSRKGASLAPSFFRAWLHVDKQQLCLTVRVWQSDWLSVQLSNNLTVRVSDHLTIWLQTLRHSVSQIVRHADSQVVSVVVQVGVTKSTSQRVGGQSGDENPSGPILRLRWEGASSKSETASKAREGRVRQQSESLLRVELEGTWGGEETVEQCRIAPVRQLDTPTVRPSENPDEWIRMSLIKNGTISWRVKTIDLFWTLPGKECIKSKNGHRFWTVNSSDTLSCPSMHVWVCNLFRIVLSCHLAYSSYTTMYITMPSHLQTVACITESWSQIHALSFYTTITPLLRLTTAPISFPLASDLTYVDFLWQIWVSSYFFSLHIVTLHGLPSLPPSSLPWGHPKPAVSVNMLLFCCFH